jgi:DNA-binding XRE family transcriptional regulator
MKQVTLLELIRRGRSLNRKKLSDLSGVALRTIYAIEREGYTGYKKSTAQKLAKALDVSEHLFII